MTAAELVARARLYGMDLWWQDGAVRWKAGDDMARTMLPELRDHKADVAEFLREEAEGGWHWRLHYNDGRPPREVAVWPPVDGDGMLELFPDSYNECIFPPAAVPALSADDEAAVRAWLHHIDETDERTIAETLLTCRRDPDALSYFRRRASGAIS